MQLVDGDLELLAGARELRVRNPYQGFIGHFGIEQLFRLQRRQKARVLRSAAREGVGKQLVGHGWVVRRGERDRIAGKLVRGKEQTALAVE